MKSVFHPKLNLPRHIPVMALSNALLFPNALLPLHIFEERYKKMLRFCVDTDRMFCVALKKSQKQEAATSDDFYHVAGLGLIRASVSMEDGTSNLILQGLSRVELTNFIQEDPFWIAEVRELQSEIPNTVEAEALGSKVVELCRSLKSDGMQLPVALDQHLISLSDPEVLSDIITHAFVRDPEKRQQILEQLIVSERLRLLINYLKKEIK